MLTQFQTFTFLGNFQVGLEPNKYLPLERKCFFLCIHINPFNTRTPFQTLWWSSQELVSWIWWLSVVSTLFYVVFFAVGPGSIPWMITAELFSQVDYDDDEENGFGCALSEQEKVFWNCTSGFMNCTFCRVLDQQPCLLRCSSTGNGQTRSPSPN